MQWNQANRDRLEALLRESRETGRPLQEYKRDRNPQWDDVPFDDSDITLTIHDLTKIRVKPEEPEQQIGAITPTQVRVIMGIPATIKWYTYEELMKFFTFPDGSVIGKKVE